jgi:hypothetical protein
MHSECIVGRGAPNRKMIAGYCTILMYTSTLFRTVQYRSTVNSYYFMCEIDVTS